MNPIDDIAAQLDRLWNGQTLATLRDEASRQLNGTSFQSLRTSTGPRRVLIVCVTGEHELQKLRHLNPSGEQSFGDWSDVSLFDAVGRAIMAGGFAYCFDGSQPRKPSTPVVFVAATAEAISKLEAIFRL